MNASQGGRRLEPARDRCPAVIWHDLECGSYAADLPLWRELAARAGTEGTAEPVLDVGAGTGRVALDLARRGHLVTALDLDAELLAALQERASGLPVETVRADARSFELDGRGFGLCIAPMQTVQLLGGPAGRIAFLGRARAHLRPGGILACAIVTAFEPFDCAAGDAGPSAETARLDDVLYSSRATRVSVRLDAILIERERRIVSPVEATSERNVVELACVGESQLRREGIEAGLTPLPSRSVDPTYEHIGSAVVMFHA
ncbi:MAG TPA: class I SAM-dependent methyltransferase [Solirubrobacteraceae bacterium]|nr:class I SAM-dependent methyltransferase [Solirubrobacteraceae bacterium]